MPKTLCQQHPGQCMGDPACGDRLCPGHPVQVQGRRRLERCVFGDAKPTCANCTVHCYNAEMREKMRAMMRWPVAFQTGGGSWANGRAARSSSGAVGAIAASVGGRAAVDKAGLPSPRRGGHDAARVGGLDGGAEHRPGDLHVGLERGGAGVGPVVHVPLRRLGRGELGCQ